MQRTLSETEPLLDQLLCSVQTGVWFIQVKLTKISYIATKFKVRFKQDTGLSWVQIRQVLFKVRFIQDVGLSWVQIRQVLFKVWCIQDTGLSRVQFSLVLFKAWCIQDAGLSRAQIRQDLFKVWCIQDTGLSRVQIRQVLLKVRFIQGSVQSALIKVRLKQNVCLSWVQFRQYPCLSRVQLRQVSTVLIAIITFRHFIYLYRVHQTFLLLFCLGEGGGLDQVDVQKT